MKAGCRIHVGSDAGNQSIAAVYHFSMLCERMESLSVEMRKQTNVGSWEKERRKARIVSCPGFINKVTRNCSNIWGNPHNHRKSIGAALIQIADWNRQLAELRSLARKQAYKFAFHPWVQDCEFQLISVFRSEGSRKSGTIWKLMLCEGIIPKQIS